MRRVIELLAALGSLVLNGIALPILIAQYPEFFNDNVWVLPAAFIFSIILFLPLAADYVGYPVLDYIYRNYRGKRFYMDWLIVMISGAALGTLFTGGGYVVFLKHKAHLQSRRQTIKTSPAHEPLPGRVPTGMTLHPPAGDIHLTFRSSPLLTPRVTSRISRDLTKFRDYFVRLGIPVPIELPPFGTQRANDSGSSAPPGLPVYRGKLEMGEHTVSDPMKATSIYCQYVLNNFAYAPDSPLQPALSNFRNIGATILFSQMICSYLNASFWNKPPTGLDNGFLTAALWTVRTRFGQGFTDELVGYTFRAIMDDPAKSPGDDLYKYFISKIQIGDSVVDNDGSRWPAILELLQQHGVPGAN